MSRSDYVFYIYIVVELVYFEFKFEFRGGFVAECFCLYLFFGVCKLIGFFYFEVEKIWMFEWMEIWLMIFNLCISYDVIYLE